MPGMLDRATEEQIIPPASPSLRKPALIAFGAVSVLLLAGAFVYLRDEPLADDSDLLPILRDSTEPNPLEAFFKKLPPLEPAWIEEHGSLDLWLAPPEKLASLTDRVPGSWELLTPLMRTDGNHWSWPEVTPDIDWQTTSGLSADRLLAVGRIASLRIALLARSGREAEARADTLLFTEFNLRLRKMNGLLLHKLIADSMAGAGQADLRRLAYACNDAEWLSMAQKILTLAEPQQADAIEDIKLDYLSFKNTVLLHPDLLRQQRNAPRWLLACHLPHKTISDHANRLRRLSKSIDQSWAEGIEQSRQLSKELEGLQAEGWRFYLRPNYLGNQLAIKNESAYRYAVEIPSKAVARSRLTVLALALRRHELAAKELPKELSTLAPDFVAAVPLDPFDNQPIRWNVATKRLYSVGPNLVDEAGDGDDIAISYGHEPVSRKARKPSP